MRNLEAKMRGNLGALIQADADSITFRERFDIVVCAINIKRKTNKSKSIEQKGRRVRQARSRILKTSFEL